MPPPSQTRTRPALSIKKSTVVPKEETEVVETLAKLKISVSPSVLSNGCMKLHLSKYRSKLQKPNPSFCQKIQDCRH